MSFFASPRNFALAPDDTQITTTSGLCTARSAMDFSKLKLPPGVNPKSVQALADVVAQAVKAPALKSTAVVAEKLQFFFPQSVTLEPGSTGLREHMPQAQYARRTLHATMHKLPLYMDMDPQGTAATFRKAIEAAMPPGVQLFDFNIEINAKGFAEIHAAVAQDAVMSAFTAEAKSMIDDAVKNVEARKAAARASEVSIGIICGLVSAKDVAVIDRIINFVGANGPCYAGHTREQLGSLARGMTLQIADGPIVTLSKILDAVVRSNAPRSWDTLVKVPLAEVAAIRDRLRAEFPEASLPRDRAVFKTHPMPEIFAPAFATMNALERDQAMSAIMARVNSTIDKNFEGSVSVSREQVRAIIDGTTVSTPIPVRDLVYNLLNIGSMQDDSWWEHTNLDQAAVTRLRNKVAMAARHGPVQPLPPQNPTVTFKADALFAQVPHEDRFLLNDILNAAHNGNFTPSAAFLTNFKIEREDFRKCLSGSDLASPLSPRELVHAVVDWVSNVRLRDEQWNDVLPRNRDEVRALLSRIKPE
jgi:hypothetical protein